MDKFIAGNREAWNVASIYHHKTMADKWLEGYKTPGYTSFDEFDYNLYNRLPIKGKSVFQAPCNNGREILSFINMGASEGVGFDISDENIAFSDKLKKVSGILRWSTFFDSFPSYFKWSYPYCLSCSLL